MAKNEPHYYPVSVVGPRGEIIGFNSLSEMVAFLQQPFMEKKEKRMTAGCGGKLPIALKRRLVEKAEKDALSQIAIIRAGIVWLTATDVERAKMLAKLLDKKEVREALVKAENKATRKSGKKMRLRARKPRRRRSLVKV